MFYVTKEEVLQRWDAIPDVLKEATALEANTDFIWKTCEDEHLPEEKGHDVARITGYVLLGFIHPEDLGRELADALKIPKEMAGSIAGAINARVFEPLRGKLNEIYEPPSILAPIPEPPKLIEEIKRVPAPSPAPPPPLPSKVSGGNLGGQAAPPAPSSNLVGEFARLGVTKESAPSSPRESAPAPSGVEWSSPRQSASMEPPPTMLHEETPIRSAPQTSSFKIEAPTPKLSDIRAKESEIPKPAIIDFGTNAERTRNGAEQTQKNAEKLPLGPTPTPRSSPSAPPPPPENLPRQSASDQRSSASGPRIVHYTEFRTPIDSARGKPIEKPQEKPGEISGVQAPPNIPLAENKPESSSAQKPSV